MKSSAVAIVVAVVVVVAAVGGVYVYVYHASCHPHHLRSPRQPRVCWLCRGGAR